VPRHRKTAIRQVLQPNCFHVTIPRNEIVVLRLYLLVGGSQFRLHATYAFSDAMQKH